LIGKLFETGDAAETAKGKINEMQQALDRLDSGHGRVSMEDLGEAQKALFAAQNRVHELDIKQARTRGEAIEKAKALAEATKDLETAQE
ncbi:hypothetical protein ACI4A9_28305, partial [Klebsiella pneumoniae]|uniref:hypothetical protein n=1 Tax=Klebsiella pneumoniae TaxID=573 RepID=UPI0038549F24